jgi:RNase H-fold protein (predicted Holliday junction resolvase)
MTDPAAAGDYPQGIKLGVDVGTVRVGVAICDRVEIQLDHAARAALRTVSKRRKTEQRNVV